MLEFKKIGFSFHKEEEEEVLKKCELCFLHFPPESHAYFPKTVVMFSLVSSSCSGLTFCINYKLSPSDLVSSWEVYYLNR